MSTLFLPLYGIISERTLIMASFNEKMGGLDVEQESHTAEGARPASSGIQTPGPVHGGHHLHHIHHHDSSTAVPAPATPSPRLSLSSSSSSSASLPSNTPSHTLVSFTTSPPDPGNPKNWSRAYKWYCTLVVALTCFVVALASSVITADVAGVANEFDVSEEVALVSISVFVVGFGVGPMVFAPLSEVYGRRVI